MTHARLKGYLNQYAQKYTTMWKQYAGFRAGRGAGLPLWPEWCWCPLAAAYAITNGNHMDIGVVGALSAWRLTQGIYIFDGDLYKMLADTSNEGELAFEALFDLPEWAVYIEAPGGTTFCEKPLLGWFAYMEWDANDGHPELRLVLDLHEGLASYPIDIQNGTLTDCLASVENEVAMLTGSSDVYGKYVQLADILKPIIAVTLYLCSAEPDIVTMEPGSRKPAMPKPVKIRGEQRYFPVDRHTYWKVGSGLVR